MLSSEQDRRFRSEPAPQSYTALPGEHAVTG